MAPVLTFLISSGSKKKEMRYICPSEAKASLRLKILMTSGVQERNPDILFISLRSPGNRTPSRFPKRAPTAREVCLEGILHISQKPHLSGSPVKEPSPRPPPCSLLRERDGPSSEPFHPNGAPIKTDARLQSHPSINIQSLKMSRTYGS